MEKLKQIQEKFGGKYNFVFKIVGYRRINYWDNTEFFKEKFGIDRNLVLQKTKEGEPIFLQINSEAPTLEELLERFSSELEKVEAKLNLLEGGKRWN
jgi:hypothetical protein